MERYWKATEEQWMQILKGTAEMRAQIESLERENKFLKELLLKKEEKKDSSLTSA